MCEVILDYGGWCLERCSTQREEWCSGYQPQRASENPRPGGKWTEPESPKPALWGWERNGASDSCKPKYLCEWISVMTGMNA